MSQRDQRDTDVSGRELGAERIKVDLTRTGTPNANVEAVIDDEAQQRESGTRLEQQSRPQARAVNFAAPRRTLP